MNTTITHDANTLTDLLPVVIAVLFFSAGWLAGRMRLWSRQVSSEQAEEIRQNLIDVLVGEAWFTRRDSVRRVLERQLPEDPNYTLGDLFAVAMDDDLVRYYMTKFQMENAAKKLRLVRTSMNLFHVWKRAKA